MNYAGFWHRAGAFMLDHIILLMITIPLSNLIMGDKIGTLIALVFAVKIKAAALILLNCILAKFIIFLAGWLAYFLYYSLFESSHYQATPGKMAAGIIVTDTTGKKISFLRALFRNILRIFSGMCYYLGYFLALITDRKQTFHDMIARTLVVYNGKFRLQTTPEP